jgi:hypothetical protein
MIQNFWAGVLAAAAITVSSCGMKPADPSANTTGSSETAPANPPEGSTGAFNEANAAPRERGITQRFFAPKSVTLPAGTVLRIRTDTALSTNSHRSGDRFEGTLAAPVSQDGKIILPSGTAVRGIVVSSEKGGRVRGVASMTLRLTAVRANAKEITVDTSSVTFHARTTKKRDAAAIGIGSGLGAAIGAIAGGGSGAAIGALAGGGAGTGYVLGTRGEPVRIAPETPMTFTVRAPVEVPLG